MLGKLALQRTNWAALAVLAALAVALFAVLQPASAAPAVKVSINDSDNVVKAGAGYEVHVRVLDGTDNNSADFTLDYIVVSSGVVLTGETAGEALEETILTADAEATLVVPAGAEGVYTITAGVLDANGGPGDTALRLVGTLEVTVGDVGTPIGSVEVVAGNVNTDGVFATGTGTAADKTSKPAGEIIAVTVNTLNSLGNKPNADEVTSVLVFAPDGWVQADAETPVTALPSLSATDANSEQVTGIRADESVNFFVTKSTPGTVGVYAVVIGEGGTATSATVSLAFTGDADTISLGEPSGPLATNGTAADPDGPDDTAGNEDDIPEDIGLATVNLTAVDKSGNAADLDAAFDTATPPVFLGINTDTDVNTSEIALTAKITDADDKDVTSDFTITYAQGLQADKTTENNKVLVMKLNANNVDPGEYTLAVTLAAADAVTTTIVVGGPPANIELSSSHESVELGNIVTVTAAVTDKDGHAVTNENSVTFVAVGSLELTALDSINPGTKHGEAKVRYVVTKGSGTATIIVSDAAAGGTADAVIAVSTMAEEPEAMPEEEASVSCLSNLSGFSTWSCGVESSAVEIFGLVSGRGASAVHLWNGSEWVRYSVVEGNTVPGSSDFMVTEDDILYISN